MVEERVTRVVEEPVAPVSGSKVTEVSRRSLSGSVLAARVIWYIAGVLIVLLAIRFVLALLGANPNNGFADFIYNVTYPFVAPFFSLFGYDKIYGVSKFELYTLVAILIYALIAFALARIVTLNKVDREVT